MSGKLMVTVKQARIRIQQRDCHISGLVGLENAQPAWRSAK